MRTYDKRILIITYDNLQYKMRIHVNVGAASIQKSILGYEKIMSGLC